MTGPDKISRDQFAANGVLARLARLNVTAVFLAVTAYMLLALFAPGIIGGGMLLLLAAGMVALLAKTWPVQSPGTRMIRMTLLTVLAALAAYKIL